MQVGELAGIAVGATVMLNILIAGYVPTFGPYYFNQIHVYTIDITSTLSGHIYKQKYFFRYIE